MTKETNGERLFHKEEGNMNPICRKVYLELDKPGFGDTVADKDRIVRALKPEFGNVIWPMARFKSCYKMFRDFAWQLTVTLVQTGYGWEIVRVEPGNTTDKNYAYAA